MENYRVQKGSLIALGERKPNFQSLFSCTWLCVEKLNIPVRTPKQPPCLTFAGARKLVLFKSML